jgi:hypothetical protein
LKSRDVVIGVDVNGVARAYPWETFVKQSPVMDRVNGTPLLLALGPDGKSFRVFVSRVNGRDAEFFLHTGEANPEALAANKNAFANSRSRPNGDFSAKAWMLVDGITASQWNFQGCAIAGPAEGKCLDRVPALKDYWFDWRNYHSGTTIYRRR